MNGSEIPIDATLEVPQPFSGLFGGMNVQQAIAKFEHNHSQIFAKIPPEEYEEKRLWISMVENVVDTANAIFARCGWKMENKADSIAYFYTKLLNQVDYCRGLKNLETIGEACEKIRATADWLARHNYYSKLHSVQSGSNPILNALELGKQSFQAIEERMREKKAPAQVF